jgi:hypothetical protein
MDRQRVTMWLKDLQTQKLNHDQHKIIERWLQNQQINVLNKEEFSLLKYFILLYTQSPCMIRSITYANHPDYLLALLDKIY